jgi:hypothetical protein
LTNRQLHAFVNFLTILFERTSASSFSFSQRPPDNEQLLVVILQPTLKKKEEKKRKTVATDFSQTGLKTEIILQELHIDVTRA